MHSFSTTRKLKNYSPWLHSQRLSSVVEKCMYKVLQVTLFQKPIFASKKENVKTVAYFLNNYELFV